MNTDTKQIVVDVIYNYLDYMYCDNCRYNTEIDMQDALYDPCEDCYRKYNGWALSRGCAEYLAEQIFKLMENVQDE